MKVDIAEQYDKIYRYCYFKLHNAHLAEDITQETFLRFLEWDGYREAGKPLAFLYTVARNLCIDEYRKKPLEELPDELEAEDFSEQALRRVCVQQTLAELPKEEQELLLLAYVNEVPKQILADMLGVSRYQLYRRLKEVREKCEKKL